MSIINKEIKNNNFELVIQRTYTHALYLENLPRVEARLMICITINSHVTTWLLPFLHTEIHTSAIHDSFWSNKCSLIHNIGGSFT